MSWTDSEKIEFTVVLDSHIILDMQRGNMPFAG